MTTLYGIWVEGYAPGVMFTERALAEEHAAAVAGDVKEFELFDHVPAEIRWYERSGVVMEDGRLLSTNTALYEFSPQIKWNKPDNVFASSYQVWEYQVPDETISRVGPWRVGHEWPKYVEVSGRDKDAVRSEFDRLVAETREEGAA